MTKKFLKLFTIHGRGSRLIVHLACHNRGHASLKFGFDWQRSFRDNL